MATRYVSDAGLTDSRAVAAPLEQQREFVLSHERIARENMFLAVRIIGRLNAAAAEQTLEQILARHEILRSTLELRYGEVVHVIADPRPAPLMRTDLAICHRPRSRVLAQTVLNALDVGFDLSSPPLTRPLLLRLGREDHLLALVVPHTIVDGFSRRVFFRDYAELYLAAATDRAPALGSVPAQPRHIADWERNEPHTAALAYWQERLYDVRAPELNPFTAGMPRRRVFRHATAPLGTISGALAGALTTLAKRHDYVAPASLLAVLAILLYGRSGRRRLILSVQDANRWLPGTRDAIGCLCDVIPLVVSLDPGLTFSALVRSIGATVQDARAHALPWAIARSLLPGPCDLSLNYFRDLRQATVSCSTPAGPVRVADYQPAHRRYSSFPCHGFWGDALATISAAAQADGRVNCSVDYHDPAIRTALPAERLGGYLMTLTRLAGREPSRTIAELARAAGLSTTRSSCHPPRQDAEQTANGRHARAGMCRR